MLFRSCFLILLSFALCLAVPATNLYADTSTAPADTQAAMPDQPALGAPSTAAPTSSAATAVPASSADTAPNAPPAASATPENTAATPVVPADVTATPADPAVTAENAASTAAGSTAATQPSSAFFSLANVEEKARALADKPYENPDGSVPDFLMNISYDQWRKLRFRADHSLWRDQKLPFEVQFFHPGLFYNRLVAINLVEGSDSKKLPFSTDMFEYGDEALAQRIDETPMEFAGFRIHYPINKPNYKDEVAVFLGATYFRAVGKDTQYGLSGRGLAIDTALSSGEEFPYFREFWLVKPAEDAESITIYALMDTPSMTGAYRFVITPGSNTMMDVSCSLFARKGSAGVQKIGLGALTSMFLFGETENGQKGEYRPEVHDTDGLLFQDADGRWFWSPLANPRRLATNTFDLPNPRGFGFMQRDANFDHYQDLEARYDLRPSLWVEPRGDWGQGRLELIEIPSVEEIHDNMVAFWVPDKPRVDHNGQSTEAPYPPAMSFAYRLLWMPPSAMPHQLGTAESTRTYLQGDTLRFIIDFEGGELDALPADTGLTSVIETPPNMPVLEKQLSKNPVTGGWRLVFQVRPPKEEGMIQSLRAARDGSPALRFRAMLKKGENLPAPLTETWVYDLQMQP